MGWHMGYSILSTFWGTATCTTALIVLALVVVRPRTAYCDASVPGAIPAESSGSITLTVLYDNYSYSEHLKTGWGFSCLIDGLEKTILFDTGGRGLILLDNMRKLGLNPDEIDIVVLSHNHYDHTGGLRAFLVENNNVQVFVPVSFPERFKRQVSALGASVVSVSGGSEICEGAWSTGQLGIGVREHALCLDTSDGLFVVTGCAHPGVLRMIESARKLSPVGVSGVMGGFHMKGFSAKQIGRIVEGLRETGISVALPCHCSGDLTRQMMCQSFTSEYGRVGVGATLELGPGARTSIQG